MLILLATRSFYRNSRQIRSDTEAPYHSPPVERALTTLLVALAIFLVLYVGYQITNV